jgi:hypothetical protein
MGDKSISKTMIFRLRNLSPGMNLHSDGASVAGVALPPVQRHNLQISIPGKSILLSNAVKQPRWHKKLLNACFAGNVNWFVQEVLIREM